MCWVPPPPPGKCLIACFMEDVYKQSWIFLSISKLECGLQEANSWEIDLILYEIFGELVEEIGIDIWRNENSFKKCHFRCRVPSPSSMLIKCFLKSRASLATSWGDHTVCGLIKFWRFYRSTFAKKLVISVEVFVGTWHLITMNISRNLLTPSTCILFFLQENVSLTTEVLAMLF